jgi:ribosomal protein L12E/L44/L45/RPP1/RPP2
MAEVLLPNGGDVTRAKVIGCKRDADGNPAGRRHSNPILDTREYEVQFPDGATDVFTVNIIAERMYSQINGDGHTFLLMSEITDHKTDGTEVLKDDGYEVMRHTMRGWKLLVQWKDGSMSWVPLLKDMKESHPIEVAEYAVVNKIVEEPAFAWWAKKVLRKRDYIIWKVKARYWQQTHKYGILVPKTVDEALKIYKETGTTFWAVAIEKEMKAIKPAFELKDNDVMPVGHLHIDCHMVFDVKILLTRKARYVASGHQTEPTKDITFTSVVSRDSIWIAFLVAALNDLNILSADVVGAYLNANTIEKVYTTAGMEFDPDKAGRLVLIVRALYGLRSSGKAWRDHMAATL